MALISLANANAELGAVADKHVSEFLTATGSSATSIAIVKNGQWIFEKHYGVATEKSLYDLASLTKVIATSSVVLKILDLGWAKLDEPIVQKLPNFKNCISIDKHVIGIKYSFPLPAEEPCEDKLKVTVEDLFRHRSKLRDLVSTNAIRLARIQNIEPQELFIQMPRYENKTDPFMYADVNYIVLRAWADQVLKEHQKSFISFLNEEILSPLGMKSAFLMNSAFQEFSNLIPTAQKGIIGGVHDPIANIMGATNAGHAGLFSNLNDLKKFVDYWIGNNNSEVTFTLSDEMKNRATQVAADASPKENRGLGWELNKFGEKSFGHNGYTGTSIWFEPTQKTAVIILSNRTYAKPAAETFDPLTLLRAQMMDIALSAP